MPWQRQPQGHTLSGPLYDWVRTWYGWWQSGYSAKMSDPTTPALTDFLGAIAIVGSREARAKWEREGKRDRVTRMDALYQAMAQANRASQVKPQDFSESANVAAERVYDLLDYLTLQCSRDELTKWSNSAREQARRGPIR